MVKSPEPENAFSSISVEEMITEKSSLSVTQGSCPTPSPAQPVSRVSTVMMKIEADIDEDPKTRKISLSPQKQNILTDDSFG
jgi:hypothetical protein